MKVTFENATIADSIGKAARVAPTKGEAFDKASGILMSLDPDENTVTLRSTNLRIFYLEVVSAVEVEGEGDWRFVSGLLADVVGKLPIGSGKNVTFEQKGGEIIMTSGRTKAKFRARDAGYYPKWDPFDPEKLEMVSDLGARIQQVEWAAMDDESIIYSGIHMDGEVVIATDRIRMAMVPCEATPIYKPITIPSGILKPVMGSLRDVAIGIDDGRFLLMPDVSTQLSTRIYDKQYPPVRGAFTSWEWKQKLSVNKAALLEIIERAMIFAQTSRMPTLTFIVGKGEIAVMCADSDTGLLGDSMPVEGFADHRRHTILFTPRNLVQALQAAPSQVIELEYDVDNAQLPVKVDGGSGYVAIIMPRKPGDVGEGGGGTA